MNQPFQIRGFEVSDMQRIPFGALEASLYIPEQITHCATVPGVRVEGYTIVRTEAAHRVEGCVAMNSVKGDDGEAWFAWALLSDYIRRHPVWMYKAAISLLDLLSNKTGQLPLYALVHTERDVAHRFIQRVGFEATGWCKRFPPDKDIYELYRY